MQSEEKYRLLVENLPDIVWTVDQRGNIIFVSSNIEKILGYTPEEIYEAGNRLWSERIHPDDIKRVEEAHESFSKLNRRLDVEYRIKTKDGRWIWLHSRAAAPYEKDGVLYSDSVSSDITRRKYAEEKILLLQTLVMAISTSGDLHDALIITLEKVCNATGWDYGEAWMPNPGGTHLIRDHAFYSKTTGLSEFSELSSNLTFPPGIGLPGQVWSARKPIWISDITRDPNYLRATIAVHAGFKSGIAFPIMVGEEVVTVVVFYTFESVEKNERLICLVSSAGVQLGTVLKRRQLEEILQRERDKAQMYLDVAEVILVAIDSAQNVTLINKKGCEVLGYAGKEIIGKNWFDNFVPQRMRGELKAGFLKIMNREIDPVEYRECPIITRNGEERVIAWHNTLLKEEKGGIVGMLRSGEDVTEHKQMEKEQATLREMLYHAQRLDSIGKLAGGIAHNFNNILTVIMGYASILGMDMDKFNPLQEYVQKILTTSESAAHLVRDLLTFSRKESNDPKQIKVNEIIKKVALFLPKVIGEYIEIGVKLTDRDPVVMADGVQMEQVLTTLAMNAKDAMPGGGSLSIITDVVELDRNFVIVHGYGALGMYALISVTDTGTGMTAETIGRIFEPFFTTKAVGVGTGLGLAVVYGIVKQHKGYIHVYSEPDKGTTFKIYLPLIKFSWEERALNDIPTPVGGTETILIAEDEAEVRKLTKMILSGFGYKIIEAVNGEDAIHKFMENKDRIQLLVLDVIMPGKNGKEAYDVINKINPHIKAIFVSGYGEDVVYKRDFLCEGINCISKPILPMEFLKKVRELLDK